MYARHPTATNKFKDLRTDYEVGNPRAVLDGNLDGFIDAYLRMRLAQGETKTA